MDNVKYYIKPLTAELYALSSGNYYAVRKEIRLAYTTREDIGRNRVSNKGRVIEWRYNGKTVQLMPSVTY